MRRIIKILVIVILLILCGLVAIPFVVPMDTLKNQAIAKIEAMTGRKVAMGNIKLSAFPNIALSAENVSIGNPAWVQGAGNMAEVKTLRIGVELMPLLHKEVHVTDLTLESPVIRLIKQGTQANWQLQTLSTSAAPSTEQVKEVKSEKSHAATPLMLDSLSIKNGSVSYEDSASGTKQLSDVNIKLLAPDLSKQVSIKGDAQYTGKKIDVDLTLGSPLTLTSGTTPSSVDAKLGYGSLNTTINGKFAILKSVPQFSGTIAIPELDTSALGSEEGKPAAAKPAAPAPAASGGRWSDAPINLDALSSANAEIAITISKLITPKVTLSDVKARVQLNNGVLVVVTDTIAMYSGTAKMNITLSRSGNHAMAAQLAGIKVQDLLHDMANTNVLSGTLDGNVNFKMSGLSEHAMVSSLNGDGKFLMKDGVFRGGNLLNMTKNIATSFQGGQSKGETTDFSSLSGSFTAKNGVFTNNDLNMVGPLLHLAGTGTIDLPDWQVHYLLTPQIMTAQGASASGIAVPVQVEGSLDAPSYHPDLRGALEQNLKDPAKLKDNLKNLKTNLKGMNSDTLKGLLGR